MAQFYSAKRRVTTRQIITVTVNDLDPFGQGVARHQGKALFVSGVLPHEEAEVVLVEDKKQYARAEVNAVLAKLNTAGMASGDIIRAALAQFMKG